MKNMIVALFVCATSVMAFNACQNAQNKTETTAEAGTKYICPMNCEKGKTYDKPGSCPVCNMDLEPVKADVQANTAEYFTDFKSDPAQLEAGKAALMSFTPKIKGNESAPVPLDLVHEKKMHLILVSDDLSWFDHVHPEFSAAGSYDMKVIAKGANFTNGRNHDETRFENGGKYWAFTDYKPSGGLNQVNKMELNVAGTPAKPVTYSQPKMTSTVDGYTIQFEAGHGETGFTAGKEQHAHISISKGGKPVDPATFENYLGEKAHVIMVEATSKAFVHTHPAAEGGILEIHTSFAEPGTYRGWLQFQTEGKVHTADFVVIVSKGTSDAAGAAHEGHSGH